MNIQEIIDSGIIELYVMNALPEDEAANMASLAQTHPEIRMEIEKIEETLQKYAQAAAIAPRPELKEELLKRIQSETPKPKIATPPLSKLPWLWAAAASIVAIVAIAQVFNQKKALSDCTIENTKLIENQKNAHQVAYKLDILRNAHTKPIEMKGTDIAPDAKVMVYWNPKEKATLLSIQNLSQPPKGKQYQLWAIVDSKPVSAGVFAYDLTAMQEMKAFEKASAFAVTLEPEGGSITPTLTDMYVMGKVL